MEVNATLAVLIQATTFVTMGGDCVRIPAGTVVAVDPTEHIAVWGGEHFELEANEYRLLH